MLEIQTSKKYLIKPACLSPVVLLWMPVCPTLKEKKSENVKQNHIKLIVHFYLPFENIYVCNISTLQTIRWVNKNNPLKIFADNLRMATNFKV